MEWKRKCIEEFREIRGGIAGVIINKHLLILFIFYFISYDEAIKIFPEDFYFANKALLMEKMKRI